MDRMIKWHMVVLLSHPSSQDCVVWQNCEISHPIESLLVKAGNFLRAGSIWSGWSDETPNKYFSQSYHQAPVLMFCHFLKWFLSFIVCSEKNTGKKDYVRFSVKESVQFKPTDSKDKCVLLIVEFLFPMDTIYVDHMCFRFYLHLISSIYHQFQHRI